MKTFLILIALTMSFNSFVFAQTAQSVPAVVKEYLMALQTKEERTVNLAWKKLDQDKNAIEYLKKNMPKVYHSYRLKGLAIRLENLATTLPAATSVAPSASTTTGTVGGQDNRSAVFNAPNQAATSNSDVSRGALNQRAVPNSISTVQDSSSRNLESNQDYIRHAK